MRTLKLLFVAIVTTFVTGCAPSPTEGIISVIDLGTNNPVPLANVRLTVENPSNPNAGYYLCNESELVLDRTWQTNEAGVTEKICFKLPAVIKVTATATDGSGKSGTTTLSLVEGETTNVTCKISN